MSQSDELIESHIRASLGPGATEGQKHLLRHSLYAIGRAFIAEDRVMQQQARMSANMAQIERAMRGASQ